MHLLRYILLLVFFISCASYNLDTKPVRFGVKIGISPTGKLESYLILRGRINGVAVNYSPEKNGFLNYAAGSWPLPYSGKQNYLQKNKVEVFRVINQKTGDSIWHCPALDSLWKLRFQIHPFFSDWKDGWSNGAIKPSLKQQEFLYTNYNIRSFESSFFIDSSFFKILRDVVDTNWILQYKSLK